jgi:hypothetical protein
MAKFWFWLFVINVVFCVIDAVRLSFFGYTLPVYAQITDQVVIALLFTALAIREYGKGSK